MRTGCVSKTGLTQAAFNETAARRFASKCGQMDANGCIPWIGPKTYKGYGYFRIGNGYSMRTSSHRVAWVFAYGDLAPGLLVLHKCDNPSCVNPQHLFLGSPSDNTHDMVSKNRHSWRKRLPWQKLVDGDIETIFELERDGCTQQFIADKVGVSRPLISMIESGRIQYAERVRARENVIE